MLDEKFSASPVYQWTIEKGIAIGEERGKAEGEAQANTQILTQARLKVVQVVVARFLPLAGLAGGILAVTNDLDSLLDLLVDLAKAQSIEEAQRILHTRQENGKYKNTDDTLSIPPDYRTLDKSDESEVTDFDRGKAEGIALGQALAKDEMLVQLQSKGNSIVFGQFSSLTRIAREVLAAITDPSLLLLIVVKLAQAQSTEEAEQILLKAQIAGEGCSGSLSIA